MRHTGPAHVHETDQLFALSLELLCEASLESGYFTRLNPAWERTLGFTPAELMARPFIEFVHEDDRETSIGQVAGLAAGRAIVSFENRFCHKDGSYVLIAWTATPSLETGLLYAAGHDVTERRRAEAEIAELTCALAERAASLERQNHELARLADVNRAVLDASADGIRLVDLEGHTVLVNSVTRHLAREVFGFEDGSTKNDRRSLAERLTERDPYLAAMDSMMGNPEEPTSDEFEVTALSRTFHRRMGPVHDSSGALVGSIVVVRETTAETEAARLKSELVATVSHELRTPLTGVLGFAELLLQSDLEEPVRKRYVETIQREAERLTALVDHFLDLQRLEAGRFTLAQEPFELCELIAQELELFSAQSGSHHLAFRPDAEALTLSGDRDRVGQVIANLLSNAIKYSPDGGTVTVTLTAQEAFVRVAVSDTGLGIPAADQEQVFTRFFRVDSSDTRAIGGTGLGLALCDEIVTAHGGRMGFDSTEGLGSTFWFELPRAGRAAHALA
jgi:PAS domain S-box-containing protein